MGVSPYFPITEICDMDPASDVVSHLNPSCYCTLWLSTQICNFTFIINTRTTKLFPLINYLHSKTALIPQKCIATMFCLSKYFITCYNIRDVFKISKNSSFLCWHVHCCGHSNSFVVLFSEETSEFQNLLENYQIWKS